MDMVRKPSNPVIFTCTFTLAFPSTSFPIHYLLFSYRSVVGASRYIHGIVPHETTI
jgi:hypothetical protein